MLFKDRRDAAGKLLKILKADLLVKKNLGNIVIISLLRGGVVIGKIIADKLKAVHLPLVVAKIPAPHNEELAIGALCFDIPYLERSILQNLNLHNNEITRQIAIARYKFETYTKEFGIREKLYDAVQNKLVIVVDDGIATGSSAKTAVLFLKTKKPKGVIFASPVSSTDLNLPGYDKVIIAYQDASFSSVSQFYQSFPQIENAKVKQTLSSKS